MVDRFHVFFVFLSQICWENWHRILISVERQQINIPLGFCVEAVSKSKAEQSACVTLYSDLEEEMRLFYTRWERKRLRLSFLEAA